MLSGLGPLVGLMSQPVLTVDVGETLWDAWQLMFVSGLHHLAVVREGRCVGVLSDRTLLADLPLTAEHLGRRRVQEVVPRSGLPALGPDADAVHAADVMVQYGVEAVPVVDGIGRLLGLITQADIVAAVVRAVPSGPPPTVRT
jgi:CBS domain-containing protein